MKIKTLAIAVAITALPTLSFAMGCNYGKHETATMSCAAGTVFDSATNSCLPTTT
ncbi:MAG: adenylosuccinate lyase [Pseudomonadota bacterium]